MCRFGSTVKTGSWLILTTIATCHWSSAKVGGLTDKRGLDHRACNKLVIVWQDFLVVLGRQTTDIVTPVYCDLKICSYQSAGYCKILTWTSWWASSWCTATPGTSWSGRSYNCRTRLLPRCPTPSGRPSLHRHRCQHSLRRSELRVQGEKTIKVPWNRKMLCK